MTYDSSIFFFYKKGGRKDETRFKKLSYQAERECFVKKVLRRN